MSAFLGQREGVNYDMAITAQSIAQQQATQGSVPVTNEATPLMSAGDVKATTTIDTLQVKVMTASGTKTMSWKYADKNAESSDLQAFFQGLITYGAIFENQPLAVQSAKFVTRTETDIEIS